LAICYWGLGAHHPKEGLNRQAISVCFDHNGAVLVGTKYPASDFFIGRQHGWMGKSKSVFPAGREHRNIRLNTR
jgi:hypothetical protein